MKLCVTNCGGSGLAVTRRVQQRGFSLVEVLVVSALLTVVVLATAGGIITMQVSASRGADYNSGMAIVEARMNDIRSTFYNPPNLPFTNSTLYQITNSSSIALNQAGTTFLVPATVISKFQYLGPTKGHLVTVTATFQSPKLPTTVSLQSIVNKYSQGQQ